jgi:hypothetical protein
MTVSPSTGSAAAPASFLPNPDAAIAATTCTNVPEQQERRTSLNGAWILDKTPRPNAGGDDDWTMKQYLGVLNVDPLAIEAHVQGEMRQDTIYTISMNERHLLYTKRTREKNSVPTVLEFGREHVEYWLPGNRQKSSLATRLPTNNDDDDCDKKFQIQSTLQTVNGEARVTEICELLVVPQEEGIHVSATTTSSIGDHDTRRGTIATRTFMLQTLTIVNQRTGQQSTTKRYFLPYNDVATVDAVAPAPVAAYATNPPLPPAAIHHTTNY